MALKRKRGALEMKFTRSRHFALFIYKYVHSNAVLMTLHE